MIDKNPPVVSVTGVNDKATYTLGAVPAAACSTSDALSGVATPATAQLAGGTSNSVGTFTATCSGAQDMAGNTAPPASVTYTVHYKFNQFLEPVSNPPTVNTGNVGRTYPVKWQLTNASGSFISALSAVTSITYKPTPCGSFSNDPTGSAPTTPTGSTSLRYDSTANQFIYNWAADGVLAASLRDHGQLQAARYGHRRRLVGPGRKSAARWRPAAGAAWPAPAGDCPGPASRCRPLASRCGP
jgi:hypothetical protein